MRRVPPIVGALVALALMSAPAAAAAPAGVWGGCGGGAKLDKPPKVQHCGHDVSYSLYAGTVQWAAFGGDQASGIGTAYINDCAVSCGFGVWRSSGSASVTLTRPRTCGDRRIYRRGIIQLERPYQGRTVFEQDYPCKLVVRDCSGRAHGGALRNIGQRATTCGKARALVRRWARASGYTRHHPRRVTRIGAYRCRRTAMKHHQSRITCTASSHRYVRFRAIRG
jgi:hypothetical protein